MERQFNKRFRATPDYIQLVRSTDEIVSAVDAAIGEGRRLVVTSGGHCLEGFVSDPEVRALIDVSPMKRVYYDREMRAIAIEAGATVGEAFEALAEQWSIVVPLGEYPGIGMGGHVAGGAFGFLCRQLGLAADYLYAVEVVTVDASGRARAVTATRDPTDANRELWWAHTGGGAGNFGIVTRYWFRSEDTTTSDPVRLLPTAPASIMVFEAEWDWGDLDESSFGRLLQNHGGWCEENSAPGSGGASLWTLLEIHRRQFGKIFLRGLSTRPSDAERQIQAHLALLGSGSIPPRLRYTTRMPWLEFALNPFPELFMMPPGGVSGKVKDALLKRGFNDSQIGIACHYLTSPTYDVMGGVLGFATYGGRVNSIAPDATASPARDAIVDMACNVGWLDSGEAERNLEWVRAFYHDLFAETGGVPVPGERYAGALINHPDVDTADPAYNSSGVPWSTLYYRDNYPRLQRVKRRWDPLNVFRHALSIRPD